MTGNYTKGLEVGRIKLYRSASFCLVCPIGQPPRFLCFGGMQSSQEYIKMKPKVKNPTCCWFHSSFKLLPIPKSVFHDVSALILNWKWWHSFRYTILWQIYRLRVIKKSWFNSADHAGNLQSSCSCSWLSQAKRSGWSWLLLTPVLPEVLRPYGFCGS